MTHSNPGPAKGPHELQTIKRAPSTTEDDHDLIISVTETSPRKGTSPHQRGYVLNALAFSTLLSSQETDAHHQHPPRRLQGNHSNLPDQPHPVNPESEDFWEARKFGHLQHRVPGRSFVATKDRRFVVAEGFPQGLGLAIRRPVPRWARETLEMLGALVKSRERGRPARRGACALRPCISRGERPRNRATTP